MTTTLFTWGYYGWGNHTSNLVEAVDAVENQPGGSSRRSSLTSASGGPSGRLASPDQLSRDRWARTDTGG